MGLAQQRQLVSEKEGPGRAELLKLLVSGVSRSPGGNEVAGEAVKEGGKRRVEPTDGSRQSCVGWAAGRGGVKDE